MTDETPEAPIAGHDNNILMARLLIGLIQGSGLYVAYQSVQLFSPFSTASIISNPLILVFAFTPLILLFGLGTIKSRELFLYAGTSALAFIGFGCYDVLRTAYEAHAGTPSFSLFTALVCAVFIVNALVTTCLIEHRSRPSYARYFDVAWKHATQLALGLLFVGLFWIVLELGAALFRMIGFDFFTTLLSESWFSYPATALAASASIHITDIQPALIRSTRSLALTLFSWLLPLLAIIVLGFLCRLAFTSLSPLWDLDYPSGILLGAAGILVFLINCTYQDGSTSNIILRVKKIACNLAVVELLPLIGLAIWALFLRVSHYGWTVHRILVAATIVLGLCYAVGYASALIKNSAWLKRLEPTNIFAAYVFLALIIILYSPILDPARLMVTDQIARLQSGAADQATFDYVSLHNEGEKWGDQALAKLVATYKGSDASKIRENAETALHNNNLIPQFTIKSIAVYPSGRTLPADFISQIPVSDSGCLSLRSENCSVRFIRLAPGDPESIIVLDAVVGEITLFVRDSNGYWLRTAETSGGYLYPAGCKVLLEEAFQKRGLKMEAHPLPDLVIGNLHMTLSSAPRDHAPCAP